MSTSLRPHWTAVHQAPLSMGFSRQEDWSGLPFPSPRDLPDPGIEPGSPALPVDSLPCKPPGKPKLTQGHNQFDKHRIWLYASSHFISVHVGVLLFSLLFSSNRQVFHSHTGDWPWCSCSYRNWSIWAGLRSTATSWFGRRSPLWERARSPQRRRLLLSLALPLQPRSPGALSRCSGRRVSATDCKLAPRRLETSHKQTACKNVWEIYKTFTYVISSIG